VAVVSLFDNDSGGHLSIGDWSTEEQSAAELDRRLELCGLFDVSKEVVGSYVSYRPGRVDRGARIDRVLLPKKRLLDAGWDRDIGIEIKRSGEKIGKPLAQAIDYMNCAWSVRNHLVLLRNVFLWPYERQHSSIESVMLQNGIGVVYGNRYNLITFKLEKTVIDVDLNGEIRVSAPVCGTKVGSR